MYNLYEAPFNGTLIENHGSISNSKPKSSLPCFPRPYSYSPNYQPESPQ